MLAKRGSLLQNLSNEAILHHYRLEREYSMATDWYSQCQSIEPYKNYFEAISHYDFCSLKNLNDEELQISVPYRTCQPVSDGEYYLRNVASNEFVKNNELENAVLFLSSGKISFCEIVDILSRSDRFKRIDNLESAILDVYKQYDKERLVVWKKSL